MTVGPPLRILLVDDAPGADACVTRWLTQGGLSVVVQAVADAAHLSRSLADPGCDVVIAEVRTAWASAFDVLRTVRAQHPHLSVLMLTANGNEDLAVAAIRAGFDDYLRKGSEGGGRLADAVRMALAAAAARVAHERDESDRLDLLERGRAALEERHREAAIRSLVLENLLDAVMVADAEGRYVLVNPAACRLFGAEADALIGLGLEERPWQILTEDGQPMRYEDRPMVRALRGERASIVQRLHLPDGREIIVRASSAPLRDDRDQIFGVVHVIHDMSDEYAQAQQLTQSARLRSLGQLAGGVAHDLNQYLGIVVGYGDLAIRALDREEPDLPSARESLTTMIHAAVDGGDAVRRLLLFARPAVDGPPDRIDCHHLLREVAVFTAPRWRDAAQQEGRQIEFTVESTGDVTIDGWASELREALTNLIFNAVDALPGGGAIRLSAYAMADSVVVEVADSGVGMDAATVARLYEPYFTTKGDRGTGLGLPIVYGIVQRHAGSIEVDSVPGRGTTFRLTFPVAARPAAPAAPVTTDDTARSLRILVVDDEPALVTMLSRLLQSEGHSVQTATSGEAALAIMEQTVVDVVISDLGMGRGMNGWELAAAIRERPDPPSFILTTGWGAEIDAEDAMRRGVMAVVSKPYRLPDLRSLLNTI